MRLIKEGFFCCGQTIIFQRYCYSRANVVFGRSVSVRVELFFTVLLLFVWTKKNTGKRLKVAGVSVGTRITVCRMSNGYINSIEKTVPPWPKFYTISSRFSSTLMGFSGGESVSIQVHWCHWNAMQFSQISNQTNIVSPMKNQYYHVLNFGCLVYLKVFLSFRKTEPVNFPFKLQQIERLNPTFTFLSVRFSYRDCIPISILSVLMKLL